jgi:hypothetical protein
VKAYRPVEVWFHAFLILALDGVSDQPHPPAFFTSGERSSVTVTLGRRLSGPQSGLDNLEKRNLLPWQELDHDFRIG